MSSTQQQVLEFHDVADLFPLLAEEEFRALKANIAQHGQRVKIPLYQGKAPEGRARYRACRELGIEPQTEEVEIQGSLVDYVISLNRHRRHLTSSQLAALAVKVAPLLEAEAAARQKAGKSADGSAGGRGRKKKAPQTFGEGSGTEERPEDSHTGE